jgi:hypothetical protein
MRRVELTGRTFGRLTVINYDGPRKGRTYWNCLCNCGVSGRHDFVRKAQVLAVDDDMLLVRYDPAYGRSDEWVPARWL